MSIHLGLDTGVSSPTAAVFYDSSTVTVVEWQITKPGTGSIAERIGRIANEVAWLLQTTPHNVSGIGIERPHYQENADVLYKLALLTGALLRVGQEHDLPVELVQPGDAKWQLVGNRCASKAAMTQAANRLFGLSLKSTEHHVADALGVAMAASAKLTLAAMVTG